MNLLVAGLLSDVEGISSPDERERDNPSSACARRVLPWGTTCKMASVSETVDYRHAYQAIADHAPLRLPRFLS
jgi:hypothetical protein